MLLTLEKVLILKGAPIFAEIPEEYLVGLAEVLDEVEIPTGEAVFHKGDEGSSMYVVVSGTIRIHDGDIVLHELGAGEVFGELAVLDPEVRSATAMAVTAASLFRIDSATFYELVTERGEVARAIIRVLCRRVRLNQRIPG